MYEICKSITWKANKDATVAIIIDASDVVLDFEHNRLAMSTCTNTSDNIGVVVAPGRSNVLIKDGVISDLSLLGIRVSEGCDNITIQNFKVERCGGNGEGDTNPLNSLPTSGGIDIRGTFLSPCNHILVNNVEAIFNTSQVSCTGLRAAFTDEITIQNSRFDNNQGVLDATGILLDKCTQIQVTNCTHNENQGTDATQSSAEGLTLEDVNDIHISDCTFNKNRGAGSVRGLFSGGTPFSFETKNFLIENCISTGNDSFGQQPGQVFSYVIFTTVGITIKNCIAEDNILRSPTSGNIGGYLLIDCRKGLVENCQSFNQRGDNAGFNFGFGIVSFLPLADQRQSDSMVVRNCLASGNRIVAAGGRFAIGFGTAFFQRVNGLIFENCIAEDITQTSNFGFGFFMDADPNSAILNCISRGNNVGIQLNPSFAGATPPNFCIVEGNTVYNNSVVGFRDLVANSRNVYKKNQGYNNGPAGATNYVGTIFPPSTCPPTPGTLGTPMRLWQVPNAPCSVNNNGIIDPNDNMDMRPLP